MTVGELALKSSLNCSKHISWSVACSSSYCNGNFMHAGKESPECLRVSGSMQQKVGSRNPAGKSDKALELLLWERAKKKYRTAKMLGCLSAGRL